MPLSKVARTPPWLAATARMWASVTCCVLISLSREISGEVARSTSSAQKVWPAWVAIRERSSRASRGVTAEGIARLFDETRTNPACVTGQVAHPLPLRPRNHSRAGR